MSQIEAIVLHAFPFKEYDRILTLLSPQGLLKLFVKCKKRDYLHFAALCSPLTHAEFHYRPGRKDLHTLSEGTILTQHIHIRERYETLKAAEGMVQALLRSQWPGKAVPKLYLLFLLFLDQLPSSKDPGTLATIFLLKILKHEGLLQLCTPAATYRFGGERFSSRREAPLGAHSFSEKEEGQLSELALSRSLVSIAEQSLPPEFREKIATLFDQAFS